MKCPLTSRCSRALHSVIIKRLISETSEDSMVNLYQRFLKSNLGVAELLCSHRQPGAKWIVIYCGLTSP